MITDRLMSQISALSAIRFRPQTPDCLFACSTIKNVVPYFSPYPISGARQFLIAFRSPMWISGGTNAWIGSKMQSAGLYSFKSASRNGLLNFTSLNRSSAMSIERMFCRFAPFFRSLRRKVYSAESSAEKNMTFSGFAAPKSSGTISSVKKELLPLLIAAARAHHTVVFPLPPSPAREVI